MPTGTTVTPGGGITGLSGLGALPQGEIEGMTLAGFLGIGDATGGVVLLFIQITATELAVAGMLHHREIHVAVGAVSGSLRFKLADQAADSVQTPGRPGHPVGPENPQRIHVLKERRDVAFTHLGHRAVFFSSSFEDLVVDVGEVLNEGHLQTAPDQISPQYIPVDVAAGMAQVAEVIDGDPAAVNARLAWGQRGEWFSAAGEGVGEPQGHRGTDKPLKANSSVF